MSGESKSTFFKQSIWMVGATLAGGVFMMFVHRVAKHMGVIEYSVFFLLLRVLILLGTPTSGVQILFAQQTAAAVDERQARQLTRTIRTVLGVTFILWVLMMVAVFIAQDFILSKLKINNASALWMTMLVVLTTLILPIVRGVLQGQQNFLGLGWVAILDGVGRFIAVAIIVLLLNGKTTGAMFGAWIGQILSVSVGLWLARKLIFGPSEIFSWGEWLKRVLPLTFGIGILLFIPTADVVFVKSLFTEKQAALYMPGSMIGFALAQFAGPLTAVMFPKIVRSAARSEKTDALKLTFLTTAIVVVAGSLVATVLPTIPLKVIFGNDPEYLAAAPIVPWFCWSISVMTLATVLINNFLARGNFAVVKWLAALSVLYIAALWLQRKPLLEMDPVAALTQVVQTVGLFSLFFLAVSAWFTWGKKS